MDYIKYCELCYFEEFIDFSILSDTEGFFGQAMMICEAAWNTLKEDVFQRDFSKTLDMNIV